MPAICELDSREMYGRALENGSYLLDCRLWYLRNHVMNLLNYDIGDEIQ